MAVCANPKCSKTFEPGLHHPGQKYCCKKCKNIVYKISHKEESHTYEAARYANNKKDRKAYRAAHLKEERIRHAKWYLTNRVQIQSKQRVYIANHKDERNTHYIAYRMGLKLAAYVILGNKCAWPGCAITDPDMLNIEHINNDGHEHRKSIGGSTIYSQIIGGSCPFDVQLMCGGHNQKKKLMLGRGEKLPESLLSKSMQTCKAVV